MITSERGLIFLLFLQAAIISLGLIGAGTNNARLAGMLRNLSSYYYKDASLLFCVMCSFFFLFLFPREIKTLLHVEIIVLTW